MWVIAGLGNPGARYERTRHNIGFMVTEAISGRHAITVKEKETYRIGRGSIEGHDVLLIEPLLFMNRSGVIVRNILAKYMVPPCNLIVIHDDLDMETGRVRIRKTGSSGGHRGIESVIQSIGTKEFVRVKIGIGREEGMPAEEYVLRKFRRHEIPVIKESVQRAADALEIIVAGGIDKAMNMFNQKERV
jgi:PTH1 family peptidyl-tRNA hydrolase